MIKSTRFSFLAPLLLLASFSLMLTSLAENTKDESEDQIERGIQNPTLREYFRERLTEFNIVTDFSGRRREVFAFPIEDQVDRMARVFLKKVAGQLEAFEKSFQVARESRCEAGARSAPKKSRLLKDWKVSLKDLARTGKELRSTVRPILSLASHKSMKAGVSHSFDLRSPEGFEKGLDGLASDTEAAIQGVRGFFFDINHTVSLETLANNDLLVVLERIEELASDLARRI